MLAKWKCHCYEDILETLKIRYRMNIVGVLEKREKLSKIRLWLKDKGYFAVFRGLYFIRITCFYRIYINFLRRNCLINAK
jgi:hypothetical protein